MERVDDGEVERRHSELNVLEALAIRSSMNSGKTTCSHKCKPMKNYVLQGVKSSSNRIQVK